MEMMLEYKRTAAGVIPTEWEARTLDSIGSFSKGQGIRRNEASGGPLPCIRYGEIYTHHRDILRNYNSYISSTVALKSTRLAYGDILFAGSGETKEEIGKAIAYVGKDEAYAGSDIIILSPRAQCPEFLGYMLNSPMAVRQKASKGQGDAVVHIGARALGTVVIPLPPIGEQRAIATALSDADALIAGLERLIAKKRDIKQAAMQQLLTGQTRLPGFSGEWRVDTLGNAAEIKTGPFGSSLHERDYVENGTPIITVEHLGDVGVMHTNLPRVSDQDRQRLRAYALSAGDIVFSRVGSVDRNALIRDSEDGWLFSGRLLRVRPDTRRAFAPFLSHQFHSEPFKAAVRSVAVGQTMASLNTRILSGLIVNLPEVQEQIAIAAILSDMDAELSALEARLAKTRAIKRGMMQELLTGRTRLVEPVEQAPAQEIAPAPERKTNIHFMRSVFAAEIVDQLHEEPTFGHVKFEKMMFLAEHLCQVDTGSTYLRKAAGPLDRKALHSIDSQLRTQKWFDGRKENGRYRYVPLEKRGGHKDYFDQYFAPIRSQLLGILETFKTWETERCEIVATLFAAWNDLLHEKGAVSDEMIVHEVLNNWHESKQRIPEDRWLKALGWMRDKGYVPSSVASTSPPP